MLRKHSFLNIVVLASAVFEECCQQSSIAKIGCKVGISPCGNGSAPLI
jgi:hypothetical protein